MMPRASRFLIHVLLAGAAAGLCAQDPWSATIKLSAAYMSGLEGAGISQNKGYGLAMGGSYPLFHTRGSVAFEFGYRGFPTSSYSGYAIQKDYSSDGIFATALYQFRLWPNGVYLQGGLRLNQFKTTQSTTIPGATGESASQMKEKGPSVKSIKPIVGAGYRLNEKVSLEGNLFGADMKNVAGTAKSGVVFEAVLVLHI